MKPRFASGHPTALPPVRRQVLAWAGGTATVLLSCALGAWRPAEFSVLAPMGALVGVTLAAYAGGLAAGFARISSPPPPYNGSD